MEKESQLSMYSGGHTGPTLGSLEHHIMMDQRLHHWQRQEIMKHLNREVGYLPKGKSTPLAEILPRLGGGILGFLVAKYFRMSVVGQVISTAAGYGVGKMIADFYKATNQFTGRDTSHLIRRL